MADVRPQSESAATPLSFEAVTDRIDGIEGWLSDDQAARLHGAAVQAPAGGTIVEIGSFRGRSTTVLALSSIPSVTVYAIDPFAGGDRGPQEIEEDAARGEADRVMFEAQLTGAGIGNRVVHVRNYSGDPEAFEKVPSSIDVLYVDGAHRYSPARDDIRDWGSRVRPGGVMLIHDSFSANGVTAAAVRLLFFSSRWRYVGRSRSLAEYRRQHLTLRDRLVNAARQVAQLPWFFRNLVLKVMITLGLRRLTVRLGHDGSWPY